jgi:glycosyltransferase involved in cell wall biosynthesis
MKKKVCYFGIYNKEIWRTRVILIALRNRGFEVVECRVSPQEFIGFKKYLELYRKFKAYNTTFDFVIVGFPGYAALLLARLLTSKPIIFDAYISYCDGVRDRKDYSLAHPRVLIAWLVDFVSGRVADVVLTINEAYKKFFIQSLKVPRSKMEVLHKGADEKVFYPRDPKKTDRFRVVWWGSYIPLHGIEYIIEAANILRDEPDIEFRLIGQGQKRAEMQRRAEVLGLKNIIFLDRMSGEPLLTEIADGKVALGIFSPNPKAMRCVTNKIYEAMAMGKAIVTEDSPANREIFTDQGNVFLVTPGSAQDLAEAIRTLVREDNLRTKLGQGARKLFENRFTTSHIEVELIDIINRHVG